MVRMHIYYVRILYILKIKRGVEIARKQVAS